MVWLPDLLAIGERSSDPELTNKDSTKTSVSLILNDPVDVMRLAR